MATHSAPLQNKTKCKTNLLLRTRYVRGGSMKFTNYIRTKPHACVCGKNQLAATVMSKQRTRSVVAPINPMQHIADQARPSKQHQAWGQVVLSFWAFSCGRWLVLGALERSAHYHDKFAERSGFKWSSIATFRKSEKHAYLDFGKFAKMEGVCPKKISQEYSSDIYGGFESW